MVSPDCRVRLALFDLDGTLLPTDSDHAFGEFLVRIGWADAAGHRRANDRFYADYLAGVLDMAAYVDFATAPWRDRDPDALAAVTARFMAEVARPALHPAAQALVRRHQRDGDLVAIITATNEFVTRPIADLFGVDELIATELERDTRGHVTGAIRGVPCFQAGKITRVEAWLAARGLGWDDIARSTFYSDSPNDLPLLERVSHPVATNPAPALAEIAAARGWPVLRLFE
jgi:HAD superfamily hydrolase (TIGR01490 family)